MSEKYQGWTNYATWRVKLEMFDNIPISEFDDFDDANTDIYKLSQSLKNLAEYYIECECPQNGSFAKDYALAFLSDVNWYEIAEHMVDDHVAENQE